jgi:DAK2 domain fusion protein YloV
VNEESPLEQARSLASFALAAIEQSRQRIDDLNVYPVPDGDTGTNLTLTVRAVAEHLDSSTAPDRAAVAHELTRAALMGARGNSGVIFSQIVRGAAEVLGGTEPANLLTCKRALRGASDAAYRAVRRPVEGTMLTVIREMAEEAEASAAGSVNELMHAVVRRGEDALARTPELLDVLREAGVVDAGGAGLLEIVRGITAGLAGEPLPEAIPREEFGFDAVHQELSRYRYCTVFVVEGDELDAEELESELERLGDSLLVVGDRNALKVHVHTDEPGAALSLGTSAGTIAQVEIANMHDQTVAREERLTKHSATDTPALTDVVAVVAGEGNRRLFASLGATRIIEGGQTMNPATAELHAAIEEAGAPEVIVLPNNGNVILSAEQAASLATKPVHVIHADSIPAGLAAMVAFDPGASGEENAALMREAVESVATGEVTVASRDAELNGFRVQKGHYLGLAGGAAVAEGESFDEVAGEVVERLLAEPRGVLTLLTGAEPPPLELLLARVAERHPEVELDVQEGGQPHYPLLLSAE